MSGSTMVVRRAEHTRPIATLGRIGMVCYGLVHVIVAYLGVQIAFNGSAEPADKTGAVRQLAATTVGCTWRARKRTWGFKRIGSVVRAAIAASVGITAVTFASGDGGG